MNIKQASLLRLSQVPRLFILLIILIGTMILDGLMYGLANSCASCTSYIQFLTMPSAASAPILASISSIITLTRDSK